MNWFLSLTPHPNPLPFCLPQTYELVPVPDTLLELLRGDQDAVDEGDQRRLVGHDLRRAQLVYDHAELVPVLLGHLHTARKTKVCH